MITLSLAVVLAALTITPHQGNNAAKMGAIIFFLWVAVMIYGFVKGTAI